MSPDFRSLPLGFPEFWRIQLPQSPSQRCPDGAIANEARNHVNIRCHPFGVNGSTITTTGGFQHQLYAIATIVAQVLFIRSRLRLDLPRILRLLQRYRLIDLHTKS